MREWNGIPIIDDSAPSNLTDPAGLGHGFDAASVGPFGSVAEPANVRLIPRSEWSERIKYMDANKLQVEDWCSALKVPITNQQRFPYCWMYGTVGAIMAAYAQSGQLKDLNPFPPAWLGKNGRNQGGWAGEAIRYIEQFGIPETAVVSGQPTGRGLYQRPEVQANMGKHKVAKFFELQRLSFDHAISALLADDPMPVTQGIMRWSHLTYGTRAVETAPGRFGILHRNSWGTGWGQGGLGVLAETFGQAQEQIGIRFVSLVA